MQLQGNSVFLFSNGEARDLRELLPSQRAETSVTKGPLLFLVPFASLSLQKFSFPFSDISQIRNALELKLKPFNLANNPIQVLPTITRRVGRGSEGIAWFVSASELDRVETKLGDLSSQKLIWPCTLPLATAIGPDGGAIWADEDNVCSMLFSEGFPVLYSRKPRKASTLDSEEQWLLDYARNTGVSISAVCRVDLTQGAHEVERYLGMTMDLLEKGEPYRSVNLSRAVLDSELYMEKASRYMNRILAILLLGGLLLSGSAWYEYKTFRSALQSISDMSLSVYRDVFGGTGQVVDPVSQARARLNVLDVGNGTRDPQELLGIVGRASLVWKESDTVVDFIRYSGEGMDISGRSGEVALVQSFQRELTGLGLESQIGDIQQIPGGGLRFSLNVRWR